VNRISPGLLLFAFFGVLMSLAVVYGLKRSWEQKQTVVAKPEPLRKVIVASGDLPEGRAIRVSDFMTLSLTNQQFASKKWPGLMMADGKQLLNRILRQPMKQGEAFQPESFYPEGSGPDVTQRLGPGLRAISLDVSTLGIPSQATPGNFVDVIFRSDPSKDKTIPELTRTLLSGVAILAIDENSTVGLRSTLDRKRETHTVILAVPSEDSMRLKAAEGRGLLSLVLRSGDDLAAPSSLEKSLSLAEVLDLPPPEPPTPPVVTADPPPPILTEVFRRGQRQVTTFSPDGLTRVTPGQSNAKPRNTGSLDPSATQMDDTTNNPAGDPSDVDATAFGSGGEPNVPNGQPNQDANGKTKQGSGPATDDQSLPAHSNKEDLKSSPKMRSRQQINQTVLVNS